KFRCATMSVSCVYGGVCQATHRHSVSPSSASSRSVIASSAACKPVTSAMAWPCPASLLTGLQAAQARHVGNGMAVPSIALVLQCRLHRRDGRVAAVVQVVGAGNGVALPVL